MPLDTSWPLGACWNKPLRLEFITFTLFYSQFDAIIFPPYFRQRLAAVEFKLEYKSAAEA